jgi:GNAT superfamily N-acetyltransferase
MSDHAIRILDVTDADGFGRMPPCADHGFDHRSCDYWEDERGSKAARASWWETPAAAAPAPRPHADNPFAPPADRRADNPFAPPARGGGNPFLMDDDSPADNPFAPRREARPAVPGDAPRKLQLLARGLGVFGSYAKVLETGGEPAVYAQFGPLSAYPRAQRLRDLYPALPASPLPAVITCVASTPAARGRGLALALVEAIVADLRERGFSAVEAYPERAARADATSAASVAFWERAGFHVAADDERFPVVRREL